ncbi:MAG: hypothetical protein FWE31_00505 [Firmicutes bacterium]|nr:hypothetical protein [Bacillota bacterium]
MNQDTHHEEVMTEQEVATIQNKCPGCGAGMFFDIESGGLRCRHCGATRDLEDGERVQRRQITDEMMKSQKKWTEAKVFSCENCGAKESVEKKEIARKCAFCGSAQVREINELPGIQPDSVIPFRITEQTAEANFKQWLKKRFFAPGSLKRTNVSKEFTKIYTPVWSFSSRTQNNYNGTLGRTVTRTVGSGQNTRTVTETRWFRVRGTMHKEYLDQLFQAGERIAPVNFNRIRPFNMTQLKVYRQEFLSGIVAEHYSKTLDQCFQEFANFVRRDISNMIVRKYRADRVGSLHVNTQYLDRRFNYVMLPIYINNYRYKDKTYQFYINGESGKVVGRYPKSGAKIAAVVLGILAVVAGTATALYFMGVFGGY